MANLVRVRGEVVIPWHEGDLGTLLAEHADDVVLHTAVHRQNLKTKSV